MEVDTDEVDMGQLILEDLFEKHYKRPALAKWIQSYQAQARAELASKSNAKPIQTQENPLGSARKDNRVDEALGKDKDDVKLSEDFSQQKEIEQSSKLNPSNKEVEDSKPQSSSPNRIKSAFSKNREKKENLVEEKRSLTPTKKDLKKKVIWIKEGCDKPYNDKRNEKSYENFAEFDKNVPMVKSTPHEVPKILDMNQVFSDKIKERYRSTDRFIRVDMYSCFMKIEQRLRETWPQCQSILLSKLNGQEDLYRETTRESAQHI